MLILAFAGLLACKGDKDDDSSNGGDADADTDADTDTDTDTDTDACTAVVTSVTPADGATDVPVDTVFLALFSGPTDAATITVTTDSTTVAGTTALQGDRSSATFTPKSDLDRDTTYDVDVTVCDSTSSSSFTTLPQGVPAADLEGKTYDFDLATADWIEPTFGAVLVESFAANHMLIMVEDVDEGADTIDGLGAAGWTPDGEKTPVEQYPCSAGADFDPVPFPDNPAFAFGPDEFSLGDTSLDVVIHDAIVTGRFGANGSAVEDAHFEGLVDLRNVSAGEASACALIAALGGECVACPDGEVKCLASTLEWPSAPAVPGLTLVLEPSGKGC
jgi:hypothetical protein